MSTILIVEDNEKNMKLVRDILQHRGHQTIEAVTGGDGVRLARERHPDVGRPTKAKLAAAMKGSVIAAVRRVGTCSSRAPIPWLRQTPSFGSTRRRLMPTFESLTAVNTIAFHLAGTG
jgi:CheY-like chemotaxis protein